MSNRPNRRGEVTEFTLGNLVYEMDGRLYTPPRECGLLNGTLRAELISAGEITERTLLLDHLPACAAFQHVNSVRGVTKVVLDLSNPR